MIYRNLPFFGVCAIWITLLVVPVLIVPEFWIEGRSTVKPLYMAGGSGWLLLSEMTLCLIACAALFFYNRYLIQRVLSTLGLILSLFYSIGLSDQALDGIQVGCFTDQAVVGPGLWITYANIVLFSIGALRGPQLRTS